MKHKVSVLLLGLTIALAACSKKEEQVMAPVKAPELIKSASDTREYASLTLENGLRVLLISDADTPKAAVSLNVDVGSGSDPKGREGLAHFVEHMLFLGTEKYPEADAYQQFISEKGGSHNAYTAFEDTNYFFDIEPDALAPAMDRFSQFFKAPLFTPAYLERERLAVHSEYMAKMENPFRRSLDVFKQAINPEHPFAKFSVGTVDTLKTEGLEEAVKTFYQHYYFAQNMALAVLGPQSIDELKKWVVDDFSAVPAQSPLGFTPPSRIDVPLFTPDQLPRRVDLQNLQDSRSLSINFPLPDLSDDVLNKSTQLLGHLLGHEGEGSLFAYLKEQGLAESLSSGLFLNYPGGALFSVNIDLTPVGFERAEFVAGQVYASLRFIAESGIEAWRYEELSRISDLQFNYQAKTPAQHYVRSIASSMDEYPEAYWLAGGYAMADFNKALVSSLAARLVPENSLVLRSSPDFTFEDRSPWYGVPYSIYTPTSKALEAWKTASLVEGIALPEVNPYVPETLALYKAEQPYRKAVDLAGVAIWFYQEQAIDEPRAYSVAALSNAALDQTVDIAVVNAIAAKLIDDKVNKALYDAKAMGYSASVSSNAFGLNIATYGFDNKLAEIVSTVIDHYAAITWTEAEFLRAKALLERNWQNKALEPVYRQVSDFMAADQMHPSWQREEIIKALASLDFASFLSQWQQNKQFTNLTALNSGNVSPATEEALVSQWLRIKPRVEQPTERPQRSLMDVAKGQSTNTLQTQGADAALLSYWRSPQEGIQGRALTALTAQIFESEFYHQLRTEQQFGYIVYMANRLLVTTPGLMTVVQSPSRSSDDIAKAVDAFVNQHILADQPISEESFESYKAALQASLIKPSTSVSEAGQRAWRSIANRAYTFDEPEQIAEALMQINYSQWQGFVQTMFASSSKMQVNYMAN